MTTELARIEEDLLHKLLLQEVPDGYLYETRDLVSFLKETGRPLASTETWDAYKKHLNRVHTEGKMKGRRYSAAGYNSHIAALKDRLRYLLEQQSVAGNLTVPQRYAIKEAMDKLKVKTCVRKKVRTISMEQAKLFLEKCPDQAVKLWFDFLVSTGLRVSEMLGILLKDCRLGGDHYEIRIAGKGSKERIKLVDRERVDVCRTFFKSKTWLFESTHKKGYGREYVSMRIKRLARRILDVDISAHTLRHAFATDRLKRFPSRIKAISRDLGHSSVKITLDTYLSDEWTWKDEQAATANGSREEVSVDR